MTQLASWSQGGFPEGAARLILDQAAQAFEPANGYPATPNEQLIRLLWNGRTAVPVDHVESLFARLDDDCRACAIRLLAELGTRTASDSLARILGQRTGGHLPNVLWPFLLPLERKPRDADLLVPPLLGLVGETTVIGTVHSTVLGYAKAGMLTSEQARVCAEAVAHQATRAIDTLQRHLTTHGVEHRWDDEYVSVKTGAGLLLDLLGRLDQPRGVLVLRDATDVFEPWIRLWGALGLIRGGTSVASELLHGIASSPDCRIALARELEVLNRSELFPQAFLNQPSLAEAAMVEWLLHPTGLGRAPDEIRQLQYVPLETEGGVADLYVFAFRTLRPHWLSEKEWVVGVAGPFLISAQPTFVGLGATFSRFERLSEKSVDEHIDALLETVGGIGGAEN